MASSGTVGGMQCADVGRPCTAEPMPVETLERIGRMAQHAPRAGFSQGIAFVMGTDAVTRRRVAERARE